MVGFSLYVQESVTFRSSQIGCREIRVSLVFSARVSRSMTACVSKPLKKKDMQEVIGDGTC